MDRITGNIMIIDDIPENLDLLENMLLSQNFEVRPFPQGEMALKAAAADPPDLFLLDIMMPGMDGYEVCRRIKADIKLRDIPVVFLSAKDETSDKIKAFQVGGIDYITKPFQVEEVLARVENHLRLRHYQKELANKNCYLEQTLEKLQSAQTQLVQSEKMASLGVLTAGIAHEINNPVNAINSSAIGLKKLLKKLLELLDLQEEIDKNNLESMLKKIILFKEEIQYDELKMGVGILIKNIENGSNRTANIVRSLQTFSRLDDDSVSYSSIHYNLDSTLSLLVHRIKNNINIVKNYGDIPKIYCYPAKLNQVFMNLLTNAIDSVEKRAEKDLKIITITTNLVENRNGNFVEIEIADTGTGIDDSIKDRIFEPFFTTKDVGEGTGLGLAITHGIVTSHEGNISVRNNESGGATFTLLLPVNFHKDINSTKFHLSDKEENNE